MNNIKKNKNWIALALFLIFWLTKMQVLMASSSCMMVELNLNDRVMQSSLVISGKINSKESFWDTSSGTIITSYGLTIGTIYKGSNKENTISLLVEGGIVGDTMMLTNPGVTLDLHQEGIFFLNETSNGYQLYGGPQGIIYFSNNEADAYDVFNNYGQPFQSLIPDLIAITHTKPSIIQSFINPNKNQGIGIAAPPIITTINIIAGSSTAGTFSTVRITGNNFGAGPFVGSRALEFSNADNGGISFIPAPANHILSWSNTVIDAYIPTGAGSGSIRVTNDLNESTISAIILNIDYNLTNVVSGGTYYRPDLVNDNLVGGYNFIYNNTFNASAPAVASFERAVQTWRCNTFVNFNNNLTTAVGCQTLDGLNVVTFDGACALPAGVLGTSYSFYTRCGSSRWYLNENDIKFRTNGTAGINWNYGPGATGVGAYDFESVALHELGHSHQIGHTITPVTVMNYAIGPATDRRTLAPPNETAGGLDVMARSILPPVCTPSEMIALDLSNCALSSPVANFSANSQTGCNSLTVNFSDISLNTPTAWQWNFTGPFATLPASSNLQNPTVTFPGPGLYTVQLIAYNAAGNDTLTRLNFINVNNCPPPTANFDANFTTICQGQIIQFTDLSTGTPTSWAWTFTGGSPAISNIQNPTVAYNTPGTYNVSLTATNAYGTNTITFPLYITVNNCPPPPVVDFDGAPNPACLADSVSFMDLSTNTPTYWQWTFPGGSPPTSLLQNPKVKYNSPGTYNVILTASNGQGSTTLTKVSYLTVNSCAAPVAQFGANPTAICTSQNVTFSDLSVGFVTGWSWTFPGGTPGTSNLQNPVVNYTTAGVYNVTLTVTNAFGSSSITLNNLINVSICPAAGSGLIVNDGSLIEIQAGAVVRVEGGFINRDNAANIGTIDTYGQMMISGDWTNNATSNGFTSTSTGELILDGAAQNIGGTVQTFFPSLTLAGTGIKTMSNSARVIRILALNDRELATGINTMVVTNTAVNAITRTGGFNATPVQGFISSTGNGRLQRFTGATQPYLFPLGSSIPPARYRPLEIIPAGIGTNIWAARFVNNNPTANSFDVTLKDPSLGNVNPYWYYKINHPTGSTAASIRMYVDQVGDVIGSMSDLLMTQWGVYAPPTQWNDLGLTATTSAVSPALSSITKSGVINYITENFNVAPYSIPLPVTFLSFSGTCTNGHIALQWTTAAEVNNSKFELWQSKDGITYQVVFDTSGAGNSNHIIQYNTILPRPEMDAITYYKISQTDVDGRSTTIGPIAISCSPLPASQLMVYPNPSNENSNALLYNPSHEKISLSIIDAQGKNVMTQYFSSESDWILCPLQTASIASGVYFIKVNNSQISLQKTLVIQH